MSARHFAIVAARLLEAGTAHQDEINGWWSQHAKDFAESDGFRASWRFKEIPATELTKYAACYDFSEVEDFDRALNAMDAPWGELMDDIFDWLTGWTRTYYRELDSSSGPLRCASGTWAFERSVPIGESREDPRSALSVRTARLRQADGVSGAWLYENVSLGDDRARDPDRFRYLTIIDVESVDALRDARGEVGSGLGGEVELTFHKQIYSATHPGALAR